MHTYSQGTVCIPGAAAAKGLVWHFRAPAPGPRVTSVSRPPSLTQSLSSRGWAQACVGGAARTSEERTACSLFSGSTASCWPLCAPHAWTVPSIVRRPGQGWQRARAGPSRACVSLHGEPVGWALCPLPGHCSSSWSMCLGCSGCAPGWLRSPGSRALGCCLLCAVLCSGVLSPVCDYLFKAMGS